MNIAHLINPVAVRPNSDLYIAQPITFESMRIARGQAAGQMGVELLAVGYPEDQPVMPDGFHILPPLTRSVLDVAPFQSRRKLPLLSDLLQSLYEGSEADYLIYSNVDIGLQPDFYLTVGRFIDQGLDAFVINRRTVPKIYGSISDLPQIWAEQGSAHRGWDCFVFHRQLFLQFTLGNICIGVPRVGLSLLANMIAIAGAFHEFTDQHLTFHIGDDRFWRSFTFQEYADHNTQELAAILQRLELRHGRFPLYTAPGAYLLKHRLMGPLYESWSRRAYLPFNWSRRLNRLLAKLTGLR